MRTPDPRRHWLYGKSLDHIVTGLERGAPIAALEAFTLAGSDVIHLLGKGIPRDQLRDWIRCYQDRPKGR